jgi:hypothetical protein
MKGKTTIHHFSSKNDLASFRGEIEVDEDEGEGEREGENN